MYEIFCNLVMGLTVEASEAFVQHRFCDIGAEVLNLSIGILLNICTKLSICPLIFPTSQSRKPLAVIVEKRTAEND